MWKSVSIKTDFTPALEKEETERWSKNETQFKGKNCKYRYQFYFPPAVILLSHGFT